MLALFERMLTSGGLVHSVLRREHLEVVRRRAEECRRQIVISIQLCVACVDKRISVFSVDLYSA